MSYSDIAGCQASINCLRCVLRLITSLRMALICVQVGLRIAATLSVLLAKDLAISSVQPQNPCDHPGDTQ